MSVDDGFIDRILEGEASEQETAEFQAWLQVPENLQRYGHRATLHSDLRRSLKRRHFQQSALEVNTDGAVTDTVSLQQKLPSPVVRSRRMFVLAVAGLATAVCLVIAFVRSRGDSAPGPAYASVASVVSHVNGVLLKDGLSWNATQIPVGNYELQQGLLNVQFGGGVMVYVEAPARFDAISDKRVVLHRGRLSARVPPEGDRVYGGNS